MRPYTERTSATADFAKDGDVHNDFLPFNHWDGATIYRTEGGVEYNFDSSNVNYWFGYSLEYAFLMLHLQYGMERTERGDVRRA